MFGNSNPSLFFINILSIYLILINIITFFAMWIDKKSAEKNKWRISETSLFVMALMGGSIGGIIGMYTFRHKTKKPRFKIGFPIILIAEIFIFLLYFKF